MKLYLVLLSICWSLSVNAQSPKLKSEVLLSKLNHCLPGRVILSEAVKIWQQTYQTLLKDTIVGGTAGEQNVTFFDLEYLEKNLKPYHPRNNGSDTCDIIQFWVYLNGNNKPCVGIAREGDSPCDSVIVNTNTNGAKKIAKSELQAELNTWKTYSKQTTNCLIYVEKFRYEWNTVKKKLLKDFKYLSVEFVAHSVSPNSEQFELPDYTKGGMKVEGWITLDIVIRGFNFPGTGTHHVGYSDSFDFAMPCPKNCPDN